MSIAIMNRVWEKSIQKGSALLLTIALADNANHDGVCFPGIEYLKKKIRMSERATERLIDSLVAAGEIYRKSERGRGKRTQYAILTALDKDGIITLLKKYSEQFSIEEKEVESHADEVIQKRRHYDTLKSDEKRRRSETSKSVKNTSKSSEKGVVTERKTPITVLEPSSNTDSNSDELESSAPATQDAPPPIIETSKSENGNSTNALQENALEPPSKVPPKVSPLPPLAPPGYRWLVSSVSDSLMHLIPSASNDRSAKALCKTNVPHRVAWSPLVDKPTCAECVRIAMEPPKPLSETWSKEVKDEFAALCKMSWSIGTNRTMMVKYLGDINTSEPVTIEKLRRFKAHWYKCDFRGKQGSAPKPRWVSEHWIEYTETDGCKEGMNNEHHNGSTGSPLATERTKPESAERGIHREAGTQASGMGFPLTDADREKRRALAATRPHSDESLSNLLRHGSGDKERGSGTS